jgi:hypothetical protein
MGYESRLYIVSKSNLLSEDGYFGEVIASFDLCVASNSFISRVNPDNPNKVTDCYIYGDSEMITKDKYGKPLAEFSLKEMIEIIEDAMQEDNYRRYAPCLAMLRAFHDDNKSQWDNTLVVLHYGY